MSDTILESKYPITFHQDEAKTLGEHIRNNHSVALIGMKRVGISNFLRYFMYQPDISTTYIGDGKKHLFFPIDLNDLVEREIYPFWALTLKRIIDIASITKLDKTVSDKIEALFLSSIQSRDVFLVIDSVRMAIAAIVEQGYLPVLFFLRFDRITDATTPEFFNNLQGLKDASNQQLTYVFTSFRSLDVLAPQVFTKNSLSSFAHNMYIKPLKKEDTKIVSELYTKRYRLMLSGEEEKNLFDVVDGYVQYLQLALISLHEKKQIPDTKEALFALLCADERIQLQSEELLASLMPNEREVLQKVIKGKPLTDADRKEGKYLWDTGFIADDNVFSPLFVHYIQQKEKAGAGDGGSVEFSKKEYMLFAYLEKHVDVICEREDVIAAVWPEVESFGVSDWAVDRLVARVRNKLKMQKSTYEIQTIKTRGYKLIKAN